MRRSNFAVQTFRLCYQAFVYHGGMFMNAVADDGFSKSRAKYAGVRSKQAIRVRFYTGLVILDSLSVVISFLGANLLWANSAGSPQGVALGGLFLPLYLFFGLSRGAISNLIFNGWRESAKKALTSLCLAGATILLVTFYLQSSASLSRATFGLGAAFLAMALVANRMIICRLAGRVLGQRAMAMLLLVDGMDGTFCEASDMEVIHASAFGLKPDLYDPIMLDAIGRHLRSLDKVIVACPPERRIAWAMVLKGANIEGEILAPELTGLGAMGASRVMGESTLIVSAGPLKLRDRVIKRAFDVAVSIAAMVILAPIMTAIAVAIRVESRGSIFFLQQRLGRGNRLFSVYKFRSMYVERCDTNGHASTRRGDDRITKVGRIIRALSIDELPQLLNVLRGDMSLVGPRPHALGSLAGAKLFWEIDERYWHRHAMKPGITGLAQVRGHRGATELQSDLVNRLQADLEYLQGWNIWRDIRILISTIRVVRHSNAF